MLIEFSGKRVVVAGAARGIGRAIAVELARRGAEVHACDILVDEVRAYAESVGGGAIRPAWVDVADARSVEGVVAAAADGAGAVDVLVYVAGGVRGQSKRPLEEVEPEEFREIVEANLTGAFVFARAVAPGMKKAGRGRIVTISSRAGLATSLTGIQSYAAAKHGQVGLVKQLAQELGPFGITVNAVCPGMIDTELTREHATPERLAELAAEYPVPRLGTPREVADLICFAASEAAGYITGAAFDINGGDLMM